jgi:hypothetical protein
MAMAGHGPAPKDPSQRRRRNVAPAPTTILTADDEVRGPDLPDGYAWPEPTRRWWETWRNSPQSQALTATDWDFLLDTALLHAELWSGNGSVASELRLRVAKFGATPEDRLRLRMQLAEPEAAPAPKAASRYGHLRAVKPA